MFKQIMSFLVIAGFVLAIAPAAQAVVSLPDPGIVGAYRVLFTTSVSPAGTDTTMGLLNSFVTGLAQDTGAVDDGGALGTTWSVLGATSDVDVYTNTGLADDGGVPIYLVDGTQFASDNASLWALGAQANSVNEYGVLSDRHGPGTWVHTGLDGSADTGSTPGLPRTALGAELDSDNISHGGQDAGYNPWYGNGDTWAGGIDNGSLFAISGVIGGDDGGSSVPEPATATLALLGLGGLMKRRRRQA